ncbi:hypothetical protein BDW68DRAFT_164043 [Aspergillus falconensis]
MSTPNHVRKVRNSKLIYRPRWCPTLKRRALHSPTAEDPVGRTFQPTLRGQRTG